MDEHKGKIDSAPQFNRDNTKKPRLDHMADKELLLNAFIEFPHLKNVYQNLIERGWRIEVSLEEGTGSACFPEEKRINFDLGLFNRKVDSDVMVSVVCAHEFAHANFNLPEKLANLGRAPSLGEYVDLSKEDEGNSVLEEFKLLDETENSPLSQRVMAMLQRCHRANFDTFLHMYGKWKADSRIDKTTASLDVGEVYASIHPSGLPDHMTYQKLWETEFDHRYGDQQYSNLVALLNNRGIDVINEDGTCDPISETNIGLACNIRDATVGEKKLVFLPRAEMERADAAYDSELTGAIVSNALLYVQPEIRCEHDGTNEGELSIWKAQHKFSQGRKPYMVEYSFDDSGQIQDLRVEGVPKFGGIHQ